MTVAKTVADACEVSLPVQLPCLPIHPRPEGRCQIFFRDFRDRCNINLPLPQTLGQQKLKNKILPPHLCAMILLLLRKTRLNYCSLRLTFTEELPQTIWARVPKSPPPSPHFGQCPNKANIFHDKFQFFLYQLCVGIIIKMFYFTLSFPPLPSSMSTKCPASVFSHPRSQHGIRWSHVRSADDVEVIITTYGSISQGREFWHCLAML